MRTSLHLLLASGLAASAFAVIAAADAAASSCENPDGLPVVTVDEAFSHDFFGSPTVPLGSVAGVGVASTTFLVDAGEGSTVRFKASWDDGLSDYDMRIVADGVEVAYPFASGADGESADVKGMTGCVTIEGEIENFVGDPSTPVTLTAEIK